MLFGSHLIETKRVREVASGEDESVMRLDRFALALASREKRQERRRGSRLEHVEMDLLRNNGPMLVVERAALHKHNHSSRIGPPFLGRTLN